MNDSNDLYERYSQEVDEAFEEICAAVGRNSIDFDNEEVNTANSLERLAKEFSASGAGMIARERFRQIEAKGYDAEHDDAHVNREIASTAAQVLAHYYSDGTLAIRRWGSCDNWHIIEKHGDDPIVVLSIAGALIAAEIDRLQRLTHDPS